MKKMINTVHLEGLLYQHKLEKRIAGNTSKNPGQEFIQGTLDVATDDACTNIVSVHYSYVTPAFGSSGKANPNFKELSNIIDGIYGTVMTNGKDNAQKVRIDSALGVNDFITVRDNEEVLVSAKRNEGGFIHTADKLNADENARNRFEADMVITSTKLVEADEERNLPEKLIIKGCVFDFRNALVPVEFSVVKPIIKEALLDAEISSRNPYFTKIRGNEISETIVKRTEEEGLGGEISVREVTNTRKDFVVDWALKEPYVFDDEKTLLASELKKAMADRETVIAEVKARNEEYKARKSGGMSKMGGMPELKTPVDDFDF